MTVDIIKFPLKNKRNITKITHSFHDINSNGNSPKSSYFVALPKYCQA